MQILVHEWVTGGGLAGAELPGSLAIEGRAMRLALAAEFRSVPGVEVLVTLDERFADEAHLGPSVLVGRGQESGTLERLATECDYTILIAPETDGVLQELAERIERAGARSFGSSTGAI